MAYFYDTKQLFLSVNPCLLRELRDVFSFFHTSPSFRDRPDPQLSQTGPQHNRAVHWSITHKKTSSPNA